MLVEHPAPLDVGGHRLGQCRARLFEHGSEGANSSQMKDSVQSVVPGRAGVIESPLHRVGIDDIRLLVEDLGRADAARWRRLAGYLQRRGFDNERIYHVCAALLPEVDADGP